MEDYRAIERKLLSQINVTPLVDVMLVLLIIFMVTAPMMQEGIDVNLPKVEAGVLRASEEPLVITVDKRGRVFIGESPVGPEELKGKLEAIFKRRKDKSVLLRADSQVPYGHVVAAMAEVRRSGIEKVGMVTEPLPSARK